MFKVLYICTHNRCRSILAEALTINQANDFLIARSAGSQPAGIVYQGTLDYLNHRGVVTDSLISQSWDDHEEFAPDIVITVCDSAAGEACPIWMDGTLKVHWGLRDPSKLSSDEQPAVFSEVADIIERRLNFVRDNIDQIRTPTDLQAILKRSVDI